MKKFVLLAMALGVLVGCAHGNIAQVQKNFDAWDIVIFKDVVQKDDTTIYYFYGDYGHSALRRYWGWYCWEYTCDKDGNILKSREYWIGNEEAFKMWKEQIKK